MAAKYDVLKVSDLVGVGDETAAAFASLGVFSLPDLLELDVSKISSCSATPAVQRRMFLVKRMVDSTSKSSGPTASSTKQFPYLPEIWQEGEASERPTLGDDAVIPDELKCALCFELLHLPCYLPFGVRSCFDCVQLLFRIAKASDTSATVPNHPRVPLSPNAILPAVELAEKVSAFLKQARSPCLTAFYKKLGSLVDTQLPKLADKVQAVLSDNSLVKLPPPVEVEYLPREEGLSETTIVIRWPHVMPFAVSEQALSFHGVTCLADSDYSPLRNELERCLVPSQT
eukprot:m.63351 g.63351  ORF g.63351 m.63351 type:complete len:286 (-) comp7189_c0_seq2:45-902(-)